MAARGVWAGNAASAFTNPTADCALALLLAVTRRITEADTYVRAGRWTSFQPGVWDGALLAGKTLGIVGYGRIGQAVGRRAAAFDLRVIHTSRTRTQDPGYRTLDALCAEVDIVCLALPLNADSPPALRCGSPRQTEARRVPDQRSPAAKLSKRPLS